MSEYCHYCGRPVSETWEFQRDHFPKPRAAGGIATVIACTRCHHLKDRAPLAEIETQVCTWCMVADPDRLLRWDEFLRAFESDDFYAAAATAERVWLALPPIMRIAAGRMLRTLAFDGRIDADLKVIGDLPQVDVEPDPWRDLWRLIAYRVMR